jgi:Cu/Ag efflux protein CusF
MKRFAAALIAAALLTPLAATAGAQTKTLPGEMKSITATVEAIEASTRTVTLKGPQGNYVDVVAPPEMTKFSNIKVGDKVTARYYENIVLRVQKPGEKPVDTDATSVTKGTGSKPGATASMQRTITATITAIDMNVPSITFSGPNNWTYSSRVEDKKALASVKVGDKVDITWTAALLVSFDAAK